MADLKLSVIMQLADRAAAPLRNITKGSKDAAQALKAARDTVKQLNEQQRKVDGLLKQQAALENHRKTVLAATNRLKFLQLTHKEGAREVQRAERALRKKTEAMQAQQALAIKLRSDLNKMGISRIADAQAKLATQTAAANAEIEKQTKFLRRQAELARKAESLKASGGRMALAGGGMLAAGAVVGAGGNTVVNAYAEQETATAKLRSAMMQANGATSAEFKRINDLAVSLGDKLPGTTADFITMMTQLRRQGLTANTILGGTGEATAYLAVMLNKAPDAAAEFAAKMQDATRTVDRDMMALMDTIQRAYYLGVDDNNMLAGFAKLSPAMSVLRMEGVAAAKTLAPLLVMADQAGMAGEAAGNAYRKIFQLAMNADKIGKANAALSGTGVSLNFTDGKGEFGGLNQMFQQLAALKNVATEQRLAALREAFGDDAETLQALTLMIEKGQAGYSEVVSKLGTQASLQQRVNAELQTITNLKEAASGSFTNVMAALGETIAPEIRSLTEWLGEVASNLRAWIAENPVLAGWIVKVVAAVGVLLVVLGGAALAIGTITAAGGVLLSFLSNLGPMLGVAGKAVLFLGRALLLTPVGWFIMGVTAIASIALLVYKHWGGIVAFFSNIWTQIKAGHTMLWESFKSLGGQLMDGLVGGIIGRLSAVKETIGGVADSVIGWFREKLGIRSPSRVFMAAGGHIGEGAAIGISRSTALVQRAAVGLTAAAMVPMASARIDARPPLAATAARAPVVQQGDNITIQISALPGQDPQSLARAVAAELDRRDRAKQARTRGALTDIN